MTIKLTAYGCGAIEAELFHDLAGRFGVHTTISAEAVAPCNAELARGHRCVSVDHRSPIALPTLEALHAAGVQYISTRSVGLDHIDLRSARRLGISVDNVSYSPDGVADYTLMLILMAVRGARSIVRRAEVHDYRGGDVPACELRDLTVGVVGTGRIGSAVMRRLRGFGCRILAFDRHSSSPEHVSLNELLARSDVVTLHVPLSASTHHLLGHRQFEDMKQGAYLVNTGRGGLVDSAALVTALESGRLGGAALDVLDGEESIFERVHKVAPSGHPLLGRLHALPNVILSPHIAYFTDRSLADAVEASLTGCIRFEQEVRHA